MLTASLNVIREDCSIEITEPMECRHSVDDTTDVFRNLKIGNMDILATDEQLKNIANTILQKLKGETYDDVVEESKKEQDRVGQLLNQVAELENKIEELEGEE